MEQFLAVNLVSILQLLAFVGGGFWIVGQMKTVQVNQNERLRAVETELSELRKVVVSIARQEERLTAMDQRMLAQGARLDEQSRRISSVVQRIIRSFPPTRESYAEEGSE